jgi:ribosomal protein S4
MDKDEWLEIYNKYNIRGKKNNKSKNKKKKKKKNKILKKKKKHKKNKKKKKKIRNFGVLASILRAYVHHCEVPLGLHTYKDTN